MKSKIFLTVMIIIVSVVCNAQQYGYKWVIKPSGTNNELNYGYFPNIVPTSLA